MARWVRRMREVDGYEKRFDAWSKRDRSQPSQWRIERLALVLSKHHIVIGRGMFNLLSQYDRDHYSNAVRDELIRRW